MKRARIRLTALSAALALAAIATPASARWEWVEDEPVQTEQVYREPKGPGYYQEERVYEEVRVAPYVTHTDVFHDGACEVTRTYMSDGNWNDQRVCTELRLVPPHVFILDRIGRHFDRMRERHDPYYDNDY
jgi:hypothetical protein